MESPDLERGPGTLCGLEVAAVVDSNGGRGSESRVFNQRPDKVSACCLSSHGWVMKTRLVTAIKITLVLAVVVAAILGSLVFVEYSRPGAAHGCGRQDPGRARHINGSGVCCNRADFFPSRFLIG